MSVELKLKVSGAAYVRLHTEAEKRFLKGGYATYQDAVDEILNELAMRLPAVENENGGAE